MRDVLLDGLPVLDLLEITASTSVVAALTNCDQSSVSRLHRRVSDQLGLDFRKTNGHYRAHANHAVLGSLRQASQLLRLGRGQLQLQWQGTPMLRREHLEQPAMQALISQIRAVYLREYSQLPELAWL